MRLLNRTLVSFLIYSVAVLIVVTPIVYWVVNTIIITRVDETLLLQKAEIQVRVQHIKSEEDLKLWEDLDGDVVIEPYSSRGNRDSIYTDLQFNSFSKEMEPYRVLVTFISIHGKPYQLVARVSLVESEDLIEAIALVQVVVLLALLSGLVIINGWISRRIWQPFYTTLDELKKYQIDKRPFLQLQESNIKEFADLNKEIIQLTERDHLAFINQKEFTENAAHEMQTPLAVFQSKLELLIQTSLTEEQARVVESLQQATSRLSKLNRALLLLSKIDSRQFGETEIIDVGVVTLNLISLYQQEAADKGILLSADVRDTFPVRFNPTLLDILFSNLISNAVRHGAANHIVRILLRNNSWEIVNEGEPMVIPHARIFDRFQKNVTNSRGMGLGLAIAKKICDTSGLNLDYQFESKCHRFSIRFPTDSISKSSVVSGDF